MFWVGDVSITCPQTGYVANLTFKEKSNDNFGKAVVTTVKDPTDELVVLEGKLSSKFTRLNKGQNKPEPYFNVEGALSCTLAYTQPHTCTYTYNTDRYIIYTRSVRCMHVTRTTSHLSATRRLSDPCLLCSDVRKPRINYLPTKDLEPFSSMVVWADANRYSVDNLEDKAEESKRKVESDQRARNEARKQSGEEYAPDVACNVQTCRHT